ncbi:probable G-protein coupled receptor 139 [Heterodontus francisci]|uniref:probable G-protein coupled receptor 139 n=1 Tax=Heterodontus francisci TaxID=7792 RepID=UPI00355B8E86
MANLALSTLQSPPDERLGACGKVGRAILQTSQKAAMNESLARICHNIWDLVLVPRIVGAPSPLGMQRLKMADHCLLMESCLLQYLHKVCSYFRDMMQYSPHPLQDFDILLAVWYRELYTILQMRLNRRLLALCLAESSLARAGISFSKEREKNDMNLRTTDRDVTTMDQNLRPLDWNIITMRRSFSWEFDYLSYYYDLLTLDLRVKYSLLVLQKIYYPILAVVGVTVNMLTIGILSRGKCGLSKCVTRYLVAMAAADLLVIIIDLILRQIPIRFRDSFIFLYYIRVCNINAILLYAATDCSVWFTVAFTFDRFVAICCRKLKTRYCTEKTADMVLGAVTLLSSLKDITWYFLVSDKYRLGNTPWFCRIKSHVMFSSVWGTIAFLHSFLTPGFAFVLILMLNAFTVRHIVYASRARRRLRARSSVDNPKDPEMKSRRKSIILLFFISANFMLLWSELMVYSMWQRMWWLDYKSVILPAFVKEMGFMLQLLSCCTNTVIYVVTQTQFREQLKNVLKYPFSPIIKNK